MKEIFEVKASIREFPDIEAILDLEVDRVLELSLF